MAYQKPSSKKPFMLTREGISLEVYNLGREPRIASMSLGFALGYARPDQSMFKLLSRHRDEVAGGHFTWGVRMGDVTRHIRVFTPAAAYRLAGHARNRRQRERVQAWLADAFHLDREALAPKPAPERATEPAQRDPEPRGYDGSGDAAPILRPPCDNWQELAELMQRLVDQVGDPVTVTLDEIVIRGGRPISRDVDPAAFDAYRYRWIKESMED